MQTPVSNAFVQYMCLVPVAAECYSPVSYVFEAEFVRDRVRASHVEPVAPKDS